MGYDHSGVVQVCCQRGESLSHLASCFIHIHILKNHLYDASQWLVWCTDFQ